MEADGCFTRLFADGGIVYCQMLESYVQIENFYNEAGIYRVKIKNKELEERLQQLEEETKVVYQGTLVHGYHADFLDEMQIDPLMLESLPDEMRIEILSQFDMDYTIWMSQKEMEMQLTKTNSMQQKEEEKKLLV